MTEETPDDDSRTEFVIDDAYEWTTNERKQMRMLFDFALEHGGQLVVVKRHSESEWIVSLTFGAEADDSDMAAGQAIGMADLRIDALRQATKELGLT